MTQSVMMMRRDAGQTPQRNTAISNPINFRVLEGVFFGGRFEDREDRYYPYVY